MIRPVVLVDLDDTLFSTLAKHPESEHPFLKQVTTAKNGRHSLMSRPQAALVSWLLGTTDLIPVTARGSEAFSNVDIAFTAGAVLSNGALILRADGTPDPEWQAMIEAELAAFREPMEQILADADNLAAARDISIRKWIVEENGVGSYAVIKQNDDDKGCGLGDLKTLIGARKEWTVHLNGNNLAFIPPPISKKRAVSFILGRIRDSNPERPILGLGDSLTDMPFLSLCDWWGAPAQSQIASSLTAAHAA